ncbi:TPA: hypothetical protein NOV85_003394 [Pseudomonas aeruginosa]|nr:hypothetical protein [Pseudomonas aeruginosa]HCI3180721.1 hypothetical protein [Pseudomonas aeruginosa]HCJ0856957.1 hypothetical protein [Pseudomonas aeruginosa]
MSKELNKAPVEQAGGDERAAFKTAYLAEFDCDADGDDNMAHSNTAWRAWKMARAALAHDEQEQAAHEIRLLANALGECIQAAGITAPGVPLTGPQLLMFAEDLKRDLQRAALAQPSPAGEYGDAYQGAREDIAIWKRRALEAEQALRQAHNGQTFMGEPLVQPYEAPREKVNALFKVLGFSGTASVGDILDAALERLQAQPSPALPPFAEKVLAKLRRFYDCASDFESGGVDIGRHWLDLLTQLGLLNRVQRSPALWEISQQGEDLLGMPQPSPAQAEAERPEVAEVAFVLRNIGAMDAEDIDGDNVDLRFEDAEGRDTGCDVSIVEYAEKAADLFEQHDRIVGDLRADRDSWAEQAEQRLADWDEMRKERDAALARVAELEKQEPVAHLRASDLERLNQPGIAGSAGSLWNGPREGFVPLYAAPVAQAQPEETPGEILAAKLIETWVTKHGKPAPWSTAVEITAVATNMPNDERDRLLALDDDVDAQAQHSVPEGWKLVPEDATLEMVEALKAELVTTSKGGILRAGIALNAAIAAAPGKEVGHE